MILVSMERGDPTLYHGTKQLRVGYFSKRGLVVCKYKKELFEIMREALSVFSIFYLHFFCFCFFVLLLLLLFVFCLFVF